MRQIPPTFTSSARRPNVNRYLTGILLVSYWYLTGILLVSN